MSRAPALPPLFAVTEAGARRVGIRDGAHGQPPSVHAALVGPGPAVYTGLRSRGARGLVALSAHLDRLADSCRRVGLAPPDPARLRRALREVLPRTDDTGCMVRIEVRATPPPQLDTDATVFLGLWPARPDDPARLAVGVRVATAPGARRVDPEAKGSAWVVERERWLRDPAAAEHLLLDEWGRLLEGFTSNLLVVAGGRVHVPRSGVLLGVTRGLLLRLCARLALPVVEAPWSGAREAIDELAIMSSGRGIWPVAWLDGAPVGVGSPGPVTRRLAAAWAMAWPEWLEQP